MITPTEMHKILAGSFSQFPNVSITKPMVKLWCEAFKHAEPKQFWHAMLATLKTSTSTFPPTVGQVAESLSQLSATPQDQLTEGECWSLLMQAIQRFGSHQPTRAHQWLKARSERLERCASMLGWRDICAWASDDAPANRAHLWRIYNSLAERDRTCDMTNRPRQNPLLQIEAATQKLISQVINAKETPQA